MIKICFITTVPITIKAFILDVAKYLREQGGFDISFICDRDDDFAKSLPDGFTYYPVAMKRGVSVGGIKAIWEIWKIFRREKFDIIQYSTPNAACYAALAGWLARIPVRLYCQWGIVFVGFRGVKRAIFKRIEKTVCRLSTWVEPDSFGNLNFCRRERLYSEKKSSVVWNGSASGVDLKKFDVSKKSAFRKEIREKLGVSEDAVAFAFVGRITRDKGVDELLQATKELFASAPNAYLLLVGDAEKTESLNEDLRRWSLNEKRVIYVGFTNEVEKYLAASDAYLLPSYREGFGSGVVEAEAMGLPVVVTEIPGPTDAMRKNVTGLTVAVKNAAELRDAMRKLYDDEALRKTFGKNAQEFAAENFDSRILFEKILADRKRLVAR